MSQAHILVIDDDPGIREAITLALELDQYAVHAVDTPGNIIELLSKITPTVVLMDLLLANQSGDEVIRTIKANAITKDIPVILLSAHANGPALAKQAGADAFLEKPFAITTLLETVKKYTQA